MAELCSEATSAQGEPLAGSVDPVSALVAISWPKPLWDPDEAVRSRGLPPDLEGLQASEKRAGRKLSVRLFQGAARPPTDVVEILALSPRTGLSLFDERVPTAELVSRIVAFLKGERAGSSLRVPTVLVCTDGQHDRCCATHGRAVYEAARDEVVRRGLDLRVVESSHLGGHRFAATSLFLPGGEMHGRLRPVDVPSLIEAWLGNRIWTPRFRGRLGTSEAAQVAEAHLRARYPHLEELEMTTTELSGQVATVRAHLRDESRSWGVELECRPRSFDAITRCGDPGRKTRQRWVVSALRNSADGVTPPP
jgi:hypothetical protein